VLLESPTIGLLGLRIFELPAVGLPEFNQQLPGTTRAGFGVKGLCEREKMSEIREEDMREAILIPMKPLVTAIPMDDEELRQLWEDLRKIGCDGLLALPWNVQDDRV
jgi:hypothetical protein